MATHRPYDICVFGATGACPAAAATDGGGAESALTCTTRWATWPARWSAGFTGIRVLHYALRVAARGRETPLRIAAAGRNEAKVRGTLNSTCNSHML